MKLNQSEKILLAGLGLPEKNKIKLSKDPNPAGIRKVQQLSKQIRRQLEVLESSARNEGLDFDTTLMEKDLGEFEDSLDDLLDALGGAKLAAGKYASKTKVSIESAIGSMDDAYGMITNYGGDDSDAATLKDSMRKLGAMSDKLSSQKW